MAVARYSSTCSWGLLRFHTGECDKNQGPSRGETGLDFAARQPDKIIRNGIVGRVKYDEFPPTTIASCAGTRTEILSTAQQILRGGVGPRHGNVTSNTASITRLPGAVRIEGALASVSLLPDSSIENEGVSRLRFRIPTRPPPGFGRKHVRYSSSISSSEHRPRNPPHDRRASREDKKRRLLPEEKRPPL